MIFLDGSPADLNARFARDVKLDEAPYAEGFALTPSAAMDAQKRKLRSATLLQTLALWAALAAIVWLSKAGVGVFLVGALAFPVIFYAYGGYRISVWRGGLAAAAAAPGTLAGAGGMPHAAGHGWAPNSCSRAARQAVATPQAPCTPCRPQPPRGRDRPVDGPSRPLLAPRPAPSRPAAGCAWSDADKGAPGRAPHRAARGGRCRGGGTQSLPAAGSPGQRGYREGDRWRCWGGAAHQRGTRHLGSSCTSGGCPRRRRAVQPATRPETQRR